MEGLSRTPKVKRLEDLEKEAQQQTHVFTPEKPKLSLEKQREIFALLYDTEGHQRELRTEIEHAFGPLRSENPMEIRQRVQKLNEYFGSGFCEYGETKMAPYTSYVNILKYRDEIESWTEDYKKQLPKAA
jgi:hypothetical protein